MIAGVKKQIETLAGALKQKAGQESESPDRDEGDGSGGRTEVTDATAENVNIANGNNPIFANFASHYVFSSKEPEKELVRRQKPLAELTSELPAREMGAAEFAPGEVEAHDTKLASERLLLISCVDAAVGRAAAYALVDGAGPVAGRARLLNFDRLPGEDAPQTIYDVIQAPAERSDDLLIVVDAVSHRAQAFLDHLLDPRNGLWSASSLRYHLKEAGLLVVCLVPRERFAGASRAEPPFTHWAVPFLEPLLAAEFPFNHRELRDEILRQRARGRWSSGEGVFCRQVRGALSTGTLREVIAAGGPSSGTMVAVDEEQPVHNVVLYAAAFFPQLNPADFGRVVTALLGNETMLVPDLRLPPAEDDDEAPEDAPPPKSPPPREKRLAEVWREGGDRILRECRLGLVRDAEGGRRVGFADPGACDRLRERFEDEHAFTLHARFAALHQAGLLFDPSDAVAANVVRLTAAMAAAYPHAYGRDWLVERFEQLSEAEVDKPYGLRRYAELLRGLCEYAVLQPVVAGVLERLLAGRRFMVVLTLVRRLRFAPGLDEFYWMRQLMERGSEAAAEATFQYLYGQLMGAGPAVYPILHRVAPWLPEEGAVPGSRSERYALQLLVKYAYETMNQLAPSDYGVWPSRYPLLAISGAEAVARDLSLAVRWLLHPGVPFAFHALPQEEDLESVQRLVAALLAEWVFILYGPDARPAETPSPSEDAGRDALLTALVGEVTARFAGPQGRELRESLLKHWEGDKAWLAEMISLRLIDSDLRAELVWKRTLLRAWLLRIRSQRSTVIPAAVPAAV